MSRYGIVYDANKCIGCQACNVACRAENKVPDGVSRLQVWLEGPQGDYPQLVMNFHRQSCVMCDNPPCVAVCPTGASYINADKLVEINVDKCVGCKYCITACPYQARFINPATGAASKCTFCYDNRVSKGEKPACVANCVTGALTFGDLDDPQSAVRRVLTANRAVAPKAYLGTKPKVLTIPNRRGGEEIG